ncbi:hypothetical protein BU23DRAFT_659958 [Bimuria novae-zelandiae CBS 107.79]|uniref:Protein kinase domain-containing protein n=1 Tax=Bimuria novae-zelandiae CBS 107.79 TaxID=1447943 RepID=A0A6A5VWC8_9PLEO|nr:hypothetical protein BU23DRAFT_659958 [Bimuria novae-zelandiae CBS 107.79]
MPFAIPTPRFVLIKELTGDGGRCNGDIHVTIDCQTNSLVIRKTLHKRDPLTGRASVDKVQELKRVSGHPNIVRFIDFVPGSNNAGDELYLEYCRAPRGNGLGEINTLRQLCQLYEEKGANTPELFAWHLVESLLKAISWMQFGIRDVAVNQADPNWDAVFQGAIWSPNLFLMSDQEQSQSEYPRIVLGDFGCAEFASDLKEMSEMERRVQASYPIADLKEMLLLMRPFCHSSVEHGTLRKCDVQLSDRHSWRVSEELRGIVLRLRELKDEDPSIIDLLKTLKGDTPCPRHVEI